MIAEANSPSRHLSLDRILLPLRPRKPHPEIYRPGVSEAFQEAGILERLVILMFQL